MDSETDNSERQVGDGVMVTPATPALGSLKHEDHSSLKRSLRKSRRKQDPLMVQPGKVGFGRCWVLGEVESLPRLAEALPDLTGRQISPVCTSGTGRGARTSRKPALGTVPPSIERQGPTDASVSGKGCGTVNGFANGTSQGFKGTELKIQPS